MDPIRKSDTVTKRVIIVFCSVGLPVFVPGQSQPRSQRPEITPPDWNAPAILARIPPGQSPRWPSLATRDGKTVLVANLFPVADDESLAARPVIMLRIPGGHLDAPLGDFKFAYPKGVFSSDGRYHLFWAEFVTKPTTAIEWARPTSSLWHAMFSGKSWSAAELVLKAEQITWSDPEGAVTADRANRIHLVVPATTTPGRLAIVYLRLNTDGSWKRTDLPRGAGSANIAAWSTDSLTMAYTAADTDRPTSSNILFERRSADGGNSWSEPIRFPDAGNPAYSPLLRYADGELHLLWQKRVGPKEGGSKMHYARRATTADTWKAIATAPLSANLLRTTAIVTSCGTMVSFSESIVGRVDGPHLRVEETSWGSDRPHARLMLPSSQNIGSLGAVASANNILAVFFRVATKRSESAFSSARRPACE